MGFSQAYLLHDTSLALGESYVPPGLVLDELDLYFPTTGLLILGPTLFVIFVIAGTVDSIVVLDEAVATDGREAVVPSVGTRTLILSRRGCDGIRHVVMEDEKGKSHKVSKEGLSTGADSSEKKTEKKGGQARSVCCDEAERVGRKGPEGGREGTDGYRGSQGDERTIGMAWASLLEWESVPCWETTTKLGEKEQAIYISKQPISKITSPSSPFMVNSIIFHSPTQSIIQQQNCFIHCSTSIALPVPPRSLLAVSPWFIQRYPPLPSTRPQSKMLRKQGRMAVGGGKRDKGKEIRSSTKFRITHAIINRDSFKALPV